MFRGEIYAQHRSNLVREQTESRIRGGEKAADALVNDHAVRYHCIHDNTYLRYFRGHTDQVVDISVSPRTDQFLTSSVDGTTRMWDLRSPSCAAIIKIPTGVPRASLIIKG